MMSWFKFPIPGEVTSSVCRAEVGSFARAALAQGYDVLCGDQLVIAETLTAYTAHLAAPSGFYDF
jgi:hypothetical protein